MEGSLCNARREDMPTISARIKEEVFEKLERIAKATERDRSYHMRKIIETHIDEYVAHVLARQALMDDEDEWISEEELIKNLSLQKDL